MWVTNMHSIRKGTSNIHKRSLQDCNKKNENEEFDTISSQLKTLASCNLFIKVRTNYKMQLYIFNSRLYAEHT